MILLEDLTPEHTIEARCPGFLAKSKIAALI